MGAAKWNVTRQRLEYEIHQGSTNEVSTQQCKDAAQDWSQWHSEQKQDGKERMPL